MTKLMFSSQGVVMPQVRISMFEGRTREQKKELVKRVTEAVVEAIGVKPESVRIYLTETQRSDVAVAGEFLADDTQ
jgi:4-oxalocrotonate tautomerase